MWATMKIRRSFLGKASTKTHLKGGGAWLHFHIFLSYQKNYGTWTTKKSLFSFNFTGWGGGGWNENAQNTFFFYWWLPSVPKDDRFSLQSTCQQPSLDSVNPSSPLAQPVSPVSQPCSPVDQACGSLDQPHSPGSPLTNAGSLVDHTGSHIDQPGSCLTNPSSYSTSDAVICLGKAY